MYGTVMLGKTHASMDQLLALTREWAEAKGRKAGYVDQRILHCADGRIAVAVRFESKESYLKLADDPNQDSWWTQTMRPLLDEDPTWVDGEWFEA